VLAVVNGSVAQRAVRTGARGVSSGVDVVEVLEGLADGTPVLAGTVGTVREGTPVRIGSVAQPASGAASR